MLVFQNNDDLTLWLGEKRRKGKRIGFAPTMGALHDGHLDLVRASKLKDDVVVVSIFVNPTQFNDPNDLKKYPRTPGKDLGLLLDVECDVVYMPSVEAVYPEGRDIAVRLNFGLLDKTMEGAFRPGHFAGMATVVNRLLEIVRPDHLYMGQKDYQQLSIVRDMIRQLELPVELVMVPTRRADDGLALSSRNVRLSEGMRCAAPVLYTTLLEARGRLTRAPTASVQAWAMGNLEAAGLKPEYFEFVDGYHLTPVLDYADADFIVACVAAWAGDVRLIDNEIMKGHFKGT